MIHIKFKKETLDALPFTYSRKQDACMDMYSAIDKTLYTGETAIIPTGILLEIPKGYEGIIRGRSGLASNGIYVHVGTIDENYRGNVGVIVSNFSDKLFYIKKGSRIAQFTIKPVYRIILEEYEQLTETERGNKGYGSSGW